MPIPAPTGLRLSDVSHVRAGIVEPVIDSAIRDVYLDLPESAILARLKIGMDGDSAALAIYAALPDVFHLVESASNSHFAGNRHRLPASADYHGRMVALAVAVGDSRNRFGARVIPRLRQGVSRAGDEDCNEHENRCGQDDTSVLHDGPPLKEKATAMRWPDGFMCG